MPVMGIGTMVMVTVPTITMVRGTVRITVISLLRG